MCHLLQTISLRSISLLPVAFFTLHYWTFKLRRYYTNHFRYEHNWIQVGSTNSNFAPERMLAAHSFELADSFEFVWAQQECAHTCCMLTTAAPTTQRGCAAGFHTCTSCTNGNTGTWCDRDDDCWCDENFCRGPDGGIQRSDCAYQLTGGPSR